MVQGRARGPARPGGRLSHWIKFRYMHFLHAECFSHFIFAADLFCAHLIVVICGVSLGSLVRKGGSH